VTLGLFYFVISAACLALTARLIDGLAVSGIFNPIVSSVFITIATPTIQSIPNTNED